MTTVKNLKDTEDAYVSNILDTFLKYPPPPWDISSPICRKILMRYAHAPNKQPDGVRRGEVRAGGGPLRDRRGGRGKSLSQRRRMQGICEALTLLSHRASLKKNFIRRSFQNFTVDLFLPFEA